MKRFILTIALIAAPAYAVDRVSQYDFDRDGKVSFEDVNRFCTVSKSFFDRADKNDDGYLTNAEMSAARGYLFSRCAQINSNLNIAK